MKTHRSRLFSLLLLFGVFGGLSPEVQGSQYFRASGHLSGWDADDVQEGNAPVQVGNSSGTLSYAASAGGSSLSCSAQGKGSGIRGPGSSATVSGVIRINNPSALTPLATAGQSEVHLNLPVSATYQLRTLQTPGLALQAVATVALDAKAGSSEVQGTAQDTNDVYQHSFQAGGVFQGASSSGTSTAPLSITISTSGIQPVYITYTIYIEAGAWDLSNQTAAVATIQAGFAGTVNDASGNPVDPKQIGLEFDPTTPPPFVAPPLVFIPGIAGSELDDATGYQLWPTAWSSDILKLDLYTGSAGVTATDIVRTARINTFFGQKTVQEIYTPTLAHLFSEGYTEFPLNKDRSRLTSDYMLTTAFITTPNLFPLPYDWRQSNAAFEETLHQYITNIRTLYKGQKINVLAHSQGSLLIRRYILDYGPDDIDHVVTVGGPFWGAPTAIYRMLAGEFFPYAAINFFDNDAFTKTLSTFPGFQELLPSEDYLNNTAAYPVLYDWLTPETIPQYQAFIDQMGSPSNPIEGNEAFHRHDYGFQDNWSADVDTIKYLHIYGEQTGSNTITGVNVESETAFGWNGQPTSIFHYFPKKLGKGDGVVAELSAVRTPSFMSPQETLYKVSAGTAPNNWTNDEVEHTGLMGNDEALTCFDRFIQDAPLNSSANSPYATKRSFATPLAQPVGTSVAVYTQQVDINGIGFAKIVDSSGNANVLLTDSAAMTIPGLSVAYGGIRPTVNITADSTEDFTIANSTTDPALEIKITQLAQDGTPLSRRLYEFVPTGHKWQVHIQAASGATVADSTVSVDSNDDGTFNTTEQLTSTFSSGTGPVDTTPPTLAMSQTTMTGTVVVNLTAQDDMTTNPSIHYTINDGAVQDYQTPLSFVPGTSSLLKAYAQDSSGNTSAFLTTTIAPVLPVVTLVADTPTITAGSGVPGVFTLNLSASLDYDVSVNFTIRGSAINGSDYVLLKGSKKIKAGKTSKPIKIIPLGDLRSTGKKTVVLHLEPSEGYAIGTTDKVKIKILPTPAIGTLESLALVDDAEAGAGNVTIAPADPAVVTAEAGADGKACYNLISYPSESLMLNPIIVPATGSTLQWKSKLGYSTTDETAKVQISTDDGVTWQDLYSLTGTNGQTETVFSTHTVDLSPFAGQKCRVRFTYLFNSGSYYPRNRGAGWFFDDVTVMGAQTPFQGNWR